MRRVLAACLAALGAAACGERQVSSYAPDPYPNAQARGDAERLPPAEMPNPDKATPPH